MYEGMYIDIHICIYKCIPRESSNKAVLIQEMSLCSPAGNPSRRFMDPILRSVDAQRHKKAVSTVTFEFLVFGARFQQRPC